MFGSSFALLGIFLCVMLNGQSINSNIIPSKLNVKQSIILSNSTNNSTDKPKEGRWDDYTTTGRPWTYSTTRRWDDTTTGRPWTYSTTRRWNYTTTEIPWTTTPYIPSTTSTEKNAIYNKNYKSKYIIFNNITNLKIDSIINIEKI